jgi:hypothetical protein
VEAPIPKAIARDSSNNRATRRTNREQARSYSIAIRGDETHRRANGYLGLFLFFTPRYVYNIRLIRSQDSGGIAPGAAKDSNLGQFQ